MRIKLTKGYETVVDREDAWLLSLNSWCVTFRGDGKPVAVRGVKRKGKTKLLLMHRVVSKCPEGKVVDHKNGDTLDNRKANLRVCDQGQNLCNREVADGSSQYRGVYLFKRDNVWVAQITNGEGNEYLGRFKTEEEAARAWDKRAKEIHGDFARLNFPNE